MDHPEYPRRLAERMLALAVNTEDETLVPHADEKGERPPRRSKGA